MSSSYTAWQGRNARLAIIATLSACALVAAPSWAATRTHTVTIDGTSFSPETISVKRGDRVVWRNKDPFPHTATAGSKAFDSGSIGAGKSWTYVASKPGTFEYVCTFHPNMKAKLIVE
jgi:plastocyanin